MARAAAMGHNHDCPMSDGPKPHKGGPILLGAFTVLIGGLAAATRGCACLCIGPPDVITGGCDSVLIGGQAAAREGDRTAHGGTITQGHASVLIG